MESSYGVRLGCSRERKSENTFELSIQESSKQQPSIDHDQFNEISKIESTDNGRVASKMLDENHIVQNLNST